MRTHLTVMPLLRPEFRAARTLPLWCGAALGVTVCAVPGVFSITVGSGPAAALLHLAAVLGSLGLAFVLDDPAATTTSQCPSPWWLRRSLRVAGGLLVVVTAWAIDTVLVSAALDDELRPAFPHLDVAVETLALALLAVALTLVGLRYTQGRAGGPVAASGLIVIVLTLLLLPDDLAFFVDPSQVEHWESATTRWYGAALAALAATLVLLPRRPAERR
ncbi:hypothetical protein [Streptomyces sp. NPDC003032]